MSINKTPERTNNINEGIDMKQYVLEEFKDKFNELGSHINLGEHPMLSGIIKEWTQLGLTMIELSERANQVYINLDDSFISELDEYIDGKTLCVQGIEGTMNLESVSTEELKKELDKREKAKPTLAVDLSDLSIDELINELGRRDGTRIEVIEKLGEPYTKIIYSPVLH